MFLHHLLTCALYSLSYMTNFTKIGSIIMYLHDWADIPTAFTKAFIELKGKETLTWSFGASIIFIWLYSRLIVFPQVIYYGLQTYLPQEVFPHFQTPNHPHRALSHCLAFAQYFAVFLWSLFVLHIYWYVKFINSMKKASKQGLKDEQEDLT
jgi:hypothetical protein